MARTAGSGTALVLAYCEATRGGTENRSAKTGALDPHVLVNPMVVATAISDIEVGLPRVAMFVLGFDVLVHERGAFLGSRGPQEPKRGRSQAGMGIEHGEANLEVVRLGPFGISGGRRFCLPRNQASKQNPQAPDGPDLRGLG
jgi:hypothetical protein